MQPGAGCNVRALAVRLQQVRMPGQHARMCSRMTASLQAPTEKCSERTRASMQDRSPTCASICLQASSTSAISSATYRRSRTTKTRTMNLSQDCF